MKSYTDLEQSRKLAEILPPKSNDLWWNYYSVTIDNTTPQIIHIDEPWVGSFNWENKSDNIPCWSLAALLNYLSANFRVDIKYLDNHWEFDCLVRVAYNKELVDACAEMIIKLNEQKIL